MLPQSSLIIKKLEGFGGNFVDSDYLAAAYEIGKPHLIEQALTKIYSSRSRFFGLKPLLSLTGGQGMTMEVPTDIYRWKLQGADERTFRSVENLESSNDTPGLNGTTFRLKLDVDYVHYPDVLLGEDNELPLAIVDGPIADGTGFVYTVRIQSDNPTLFFPKSLLEPGRQFSKGWTSTPSEANKWYGTMQAPNTFELESQLGFFSQGIEVTDRALREDGRLQITFTTDDGRQINKFIPYYEAKMQDGLYKSMEVNLMYGKKSTMPGPDKYWTKTGPGLREQLKDSWREVYSTALTAPMLQDYLMNIYFAREDEDNRKTTAMTGTLGSILFHNALVNLSNGFLTVDSHWIQKAANPASAVPGLAYGAQFVEYRGPSGIIVNLTRNSMYDSTEYCKRFHPQYPEMPIDSARLTFLDFGTSEGKNNIQMLKIKDSFTYGVVAGMVGPNGPNKSGTVSSLKHSYDVGITGTAGIWVRDITRCGELLLDYEG
jgi:hypothetical protein